MKMYEITYLQGGEAKKYWVLAYSESTAIEFLSDFTKEPFKIISVYEI